MFLCDFAIYFSLGVFNIILLYTRFLEPSALLAKMDEVDSYLEVLSIFLTATLVVRIILNLVLCNSILEKGDPISETQGENKMKILFKGEEFENMKAEREEKKQLGEKMKKEKGKVKKTKEEKIRKYEEERLKLKQNKREEIKTLETIL